MAGEHGGTQVRQADGAGGGLEADSDSVHNTPCSSSSLSHGGAAADGRNL